MVSCGSIYQTVGDPSPADWVFDFALFAFDDVLLKNIGLMTKWSEANITHYIEMY